LSKIIFTVLNTAILFTINERMKKQITTKLFKKKEKSDLKWEKLN